MTPHVASPKRPPRVIQLLNRLNLGGPTFNVAFLTKHLAPEFESILVVGAKDASEESSDFVVRGLGIVPITVGSMRRSLNPFLDVAAFVQLVLLMLRFKPDIVHTHAAKAGALGRLAATVCRVPVVVHTYHGHAFHSYFSPGVSRLIALAERLLGHLTTAIIAISPSQSWELVDVYKIAPAAKVHVVPLGIEAERFAVANEDSRKAFRATYGFEEGDVVVGIIGRIVPIKNHRMFLEALRLAREQVGDSLKGIVVGDGEDRGAVELRARELGLAGGPDGGGTLAPVTFATWVRDIERVYAGIDIVALSSRNEGTPVCLIEGQAAGKPVVATDVGGVSDVVVRGESALLSPSCDAAAMADNIVALCRDAALRGRIGAAGRRFASERFGVSTLVKETARIYRLLLSAT